MKCVYSLILSLHGIGYKFESYYFVDYQHHMVYSWSIPLLLRGLRFKPMTSRIKLTTRIMSCLFIVRGHNYTMGLR